MKWLAQGLLKDNGIPVGVFGAKEPESICRHFGRLNLEPPSCQPLVCGINIGAANVKAYIPVCCEMSGVWLRRALARIVLSVQHQIGRAETQPRPVRKTPLGRLDLW